LQLPAGIALRKLQQHVYHMDSAEGVPQTTSQSPPTALKWPNLTLPGHCSEIEEVTNAPENVSDNDGLQPDTVASGEEAEGVVGFSIGQRQNYMKSAQTPAAEKSQAIDNSADSYFDIEPIDGSGNETPEGNFTDSLANERPPQTDLSRRQLSRAAPEKAQASGALPSPWKAGQAIQQRSSATKAFLSDGFTNFRRRASSGPSTLTENVRKFIAELPSLSLPKSPSFTNFNFGNMLKDDGASPGTTRAKRSSTGILDRTLSQKGSQSPNQPRNLGHTCDGNTSSNSVNADSTNPLLRRSTSDNSLYLRRGLSKVESLDDTSKWENVSEQVNSRFKAIQDTFQDSRLRLPKMPSINFPSFRPNLTERSESDPARGITSLAGQQAGFTRPPEPRVPSDGSLDPKMKQAKPKVVSTEHRAHPVMAKALEGLTGDVVVIGGYRGSILRSAEPPHRQLWVPVKVGLNLRKVNLEVGLRPEDEEKTEETVIPSGVLSHIGPVDICRRLLRHLRKCHNARSNHLRIHDYGYDWRLSPHLSSRRFLEFVEKLKCNQPNVPAQHRGVTVIAHSLGGLITRHAVNQRPELFAGVIYAGVPQRCVNILGPLRNGDQVLLSSRVLTAQVNFTMRTSFALLPEDGKCFIDKRTGERYDVDFFDVKTWDEYRLSPCIKPPLLSGIPDTRKSLIGALTESLPSLPGPVKRSSWVFGRDASPERGRETISYKARDAVPETAGTAANAALEVADPEGSSPALEPSMAQSYHRGSIATACTIPRDEALAYLSRTLTEIRQFKEELAFRPEHEGNNVYPPLAYMFTKSVPTVYGARVANREAIKYSDAYDDLAFAAGDGVVLASAAMLPQGYRCVRNGKVETDRGHVGLLGDVEGVGKALLAIIEARAKGVGLGKERVRPNDGGSTSLADGCGVDGSSDVERQKEQDEKK
jgi:pimeloyl-ACP methyl ester carboxylesterase